MLTDKDIAKLENRFVTRDEFHKTIDDLIDMIQTVNEETKKEIITHIDEFKLEVRQFAKEISSILRNHEDRLTLLEKAPVNN